MTLCCVMGGTGFIGSHCVEALLRTGRDVRVVGRRSRDGLNLPGEVDYRQGDIRNRSFVSDVLSGADEFIDLAYTTVPKTSYDNPVLDIMDNLPGSVGLLEAACERKLKKALFVSSGGTVYGEPDFLPITESHPTNPISPYGITKLALEKYAYMYYKLKGLPIVSARPSNPFGEGQFPHVGQGFVAAAMSSVLTGMPVRLFGERGTIRDYLYVGDVADGIIAALTQGQPGVTYNIGSGIGRSNLDIVDSILAIAQPLGKNVRLERLPARPFDVTANILDSGKLRSISGWMPKVDFETAMGLTWEWLQTGLKDQIQGREAHS